LHQITYSLSYVTKIVLLRYIAKIKKMQLIKFIVANFQLLSLYLCYAKS